MLDAVPSEHCITAFMLEAKRLGIQVQWAEPVESQLDASYHAFPGRPGKIMLYKHEKYPDKNRLCTLLSHEMVHVLQHWKGCWNALPPLGWPISGSPKNRNLPHIEKEAYTAEKNPKSVLNAVKLLDSQAPSCP